MNENIIEMVDENGAKVEFEHLMTYEYGENFYVALLPVTPIEDFEDGEVLIMRVEEDGDEDIFSAVETQEELEGAWNAFCELYDEEYEDDEEDDEDDGGKDSDDEEEDDD